MHRKKDEEERLFAFIQRRELNAQEKDEGERFMAFIQDVHSSFKNVYSHGAEWPINHRN